MAGRRLQCNERDVSKWIYLRNQIYEQSGTLLEQVGLGIMRQCIGWSCFPISFYQLAIWFRHSNPQWVSPFIPVILLNKYFISAEFPIIEYPPSFTSHFRPKLAIYCLFEFNFDTWFAFCRFSVSGIGVPQIYGFGGWFKLFCCSTFRQIKRPVLIFDSWLFSHKCYLRKQFTRFISH